MALLNVNAPIEEKGEEEKDMFYEGIEAAFHCMKKGAIRVVLGDFNAKVGKEGIYKYKHITGGESKHQESNDNGKSLTEFAE